MLPTNASLSGITSSSSASATSMRSMSAISRSMFSAWSLMITTFGVVMAARWPYCATSGRRIFTSSFESTFWAAITRVTKASTWPGTNGPLPLCFTMLCCWILITSPAGMAAKPFTRSTERNSSYTPSRSSCVCDTTVTFTLRTRGSTTKVLPVMAATWLIISRMSASFRLMRHVVWPADCACASWPSSGRSPSSSANVPITNNLCRNLCRNFIATPGLTQRCRDEETAIAALDLEPGRTL